MMYACELNVIFSLSNANLRRPSSPVIRLLFSPLLSCSQAKALTRSLAIHGVILFIEWDCLKAIPGERPIELSCDSIELGWV